MRNLQLRAGRNFPIQAANATAMQGKINALYSADKHKEFWKHIFYGAAYGHYGSQCVITYILIPSRKILHEDNIGPYGDSNAPADNKENPH